MSTKKQNIILWNHFLNSVRDFFNSRSFIEIQTPMLVSCPGTEPHLEPFELQLKQGSKLTKKYLPTSPEIHLKKALSMGYENIFEIKPCFRNNEFSETHQPEFYMLEWYRSGADLGVIREDLQDLFRFCSEKMAGLKSDVKKDFNFGIVTMKEMFKKELQFELTPKTDFSSLKDLCLKKGIHIHESDSWDDLFFRLYLDFIEPKLDPSRILFLQDYPPSQAALAKLGSEGWASRFEVFFQGLEIANAFHELTDPTEQRLRSVQDNELKLKIGLPQVDLDEDFFRALEKGLPSSSGIALGLERLFMSLTGIRDIRDFKLFPY